MHIYYNTVIFGLRSRSQYNMVWVKYKFALIYNYAYARIKQRAECTTFIYIYITLGKINIIYFQCRFSYIHDDFTFIRYITLVAVIRCCVL